MDDITYGLLQEQREKKAIAHSAAKRVGKTKKCTFVYENMPKEERKKYMANGEVTTFKLRPMTLKEYNEQAGDKKRDLLMFYGEKYGWNPAGVSAALGCDYVTAKRKLDEYLLLPTFKARMKATSKEKQREQMEARKALLEPRRAAQETTCENIRENTKNATERVSDHTTNIYNVSLTSFNNGERLTRQLSGIANSLEPDKIYKVTLLICEVEQTQRQESAPCHDQ